MAARTSSEFPPNDAAADGLRSPKRFGPYTVFEPVGRGGMAVLFLARAETELGATRLVVVKLILPAFSSDPRFSEMLIHEAKLAAGLSHRHIVQVHDLGRDDDRLYIAMEYVEGFDLNVLLRLCSENKKALPAEHALGIVADVLEALDYAHRRTTDAGAPLGIVHRDVSPSNVLISYEGEVKLCDFGIAHANDMVKEEASEALKGKAGYMSPEHARGEALDARADVFAAGIILWELLAGRRLYKSGAETSLLEQARQAEIPPLPDKGLPDHTELERIVRRALASEREARYPSAAAFLGDLEGYLARAGLLASRLKLGEWIADTFGTKLIEERRASESRLPKSVPPLRASGHVRVRSERPNAPKETTTEEVVQITLEETAPLLGLPRISKPAPESLEGTAMDIPPSSKVAVSDPHPSEGKISDAELLTWARKRGLVSFLFFLFIAIVVSVTTWLALR
jgi:serine/threonine-protein kinase